MTDEQSSPSEPRRCEEERPRVVCLCGSTRFRADYTRAHQEETLAGRIVLTVGVYRHADGIYLSNDQKAAMDALHLRKIDLADEILVLNVGGYIGNSTKREIAYARAQGKRVRWWEHSHEGQSLAQAVKEGGTTS